MAFLLDYFRRYRDRRLVRPWALAAPVVVLLISLPLLRPLRHPDPGAASDDELARIATTKAIVERRTLAVDDAGVAFNGRVAGPDGREYSDQSPTMAALLSVSYWVMYQSGLTLDENPQLVVYLLTLLGVTLPVAGAAGLIYRMGRLFELHRPWRTGLALAVVLGSGLISYATVLNAHAPAAALVVAAAACLIHVTVAERRRHGAVWLLLAGTCATLAAAIDPPAAVFAVLFLLVVPAMRWPVGWRLGGVGLYALGAAGPLLLHAALASAATGDLLQGSGLRSHGLVLEPQWPAPEEDDEGPRAGWASVRSSLGRLAGALAGRHGALSHFPVILIGVLGVSMVMHRHWPATTKTLASATVVGAVLVVLLCAIGRVDWRGAMFASRWFVVFLPLLLFWAGAWLRRRHRAASWTMVSLMLGFSILVSLLGATGPMPRDGFDSYTAYQAARNLVDPPHARPDMPVLAGR